MGTKTPFTLDRSAPSVRPPLLGNLAVGAGLSQPAFVPTILLLIYALLFPQAVAARVEVVDDLGNRITLNEPARRVIPLYGAFAEMLYVMGAGDQVVARTQADRFPPEIEKLPSVGTHMKPNLELVLGLKPDLIVQSASRQGDEADLSGLGGAGAPVAVFSPTTFDGIFSVMERLGVLTGRAESAKSAVEGFKAELSSVTRELEGLEGRRKVFFEVRAEPLACAGRGSIVQQILELAGAENVVKSDKAIVHYGLESLLQDDPDVYIVQRGPMNKNPQDPAERAHFNRLRAVREGRVIFVDELLFSRPGPRSVDAVLELAKKLYPERFKDKP